VIDRSALEAAVAAAKPSELFALAGELQGRAVAHLALAPTVTEGPEVPDENLNVDAAARRLSVSKDWLYRHGRTLPFRVKIGSRVLFSAAGLARWNRQRMGR
jgi:predicted DNA-binding transcriptional regulator AlpA